MDEVVTQGAPTAEQTAAAEANQTTPTDPPGDAGEAGHLGATAEPADGATDATDEPTIEELLATEAGVNVLVEKHPALKNRFVVERGNAVDDYKRTAERDAGNRDSIRTDTVAWLTAHDLEVENPNDVADDLSARAWRSNAYKVVEEIPDAFLAKYADDLPATVVAAAAKGRADGVAAQEWLTPMIDSVIDIEFGRRLGETALADVPAGSTLDKEITAQAGKKVASELKAHGITVAASDAPATPPVTPSGQETALGDTTLLDTDLSKRGAGMRVVKQALDDQ